MNKTGSAVPGDDRCECFDIADGHPRQRGARQCTNTATHTLWRIDPQDVNGTRYCDDCGEAALQSGLFL